MGCYRMERHLAEVGGSEVYKLGWKKVAEVGRGGRVSKIWTESFWIGDRNFKGQGVKM